MQPILNTILQNDNTERKAAEAQLNALKKSDPNKYALVMVYCLHPQFNTTMEIRSLAAVILRRNISSSDVDVADVEDVANNDNLWQRLSDESRNQMKVELLNTLSNTTEWPKNVIHKVCSLAVVVQGEMQQHEDKNIWQELIALVNTLIQSGNDKNIDSALQIFDGLFGYIMDHMIQFKDDLIKTFINTLRHKTLDIQLASLQCVSKLLSTAERKDVK